MTATAADFSIDVLTGRVRYHGTAPLPSMGPLVPDVAVRGLCGWPDCTATRASRGRGTCPTYCKRHCVEAERAEGHVCGRVKNRQSKRAWLERARRAA